MKKNAKLVCGATILLVVVGVVFYIVSRNNHAGLQGLGETSQVDDTACKGKIIVRTKTGVSEAEAINMIRNSGFTVIDKNINNVHNWYEVNVKSVNEQDAINAFNTDKRVFEAYKKSCRIIID